MEDSTGERTTFNDNEDNYGSGLPPTDNQAELTKFILDPTARALYTHITKDFAVSNLNPYEIEHVNLNLQLLHLVIYVEETVDDLLELKKVILQDIYSFINVSRSKDGFERLAEITKKQESKQKYEEQRNRNKFW